MIIIPVIAFLATFFKVLLGLTSLFLIMLVLVQRGRGGGLAGALGGMGGSSAFGAKAGDVFTKVTVVSATFWILLCIAADKFGPSTQTRISTGTTAPATAPLDSPAVSGLTEEGEPATVDDPPADVPPVQTAPAETPPADQGAVQDETAESAAPQD